MNNNKLIELIEHELVQAESASDSKQFEKHMYAIHTLTSLCLNEDSNSNGYEADNMIGPSFSGKNNSWKNSSTISSQSTGKNVEVTPEEIEAMGGKVPKSMKTSNNQSLPNNTMVTDDEIGNGESIFDF